MTRLFCFSSSVLLLAVSIDCLTKFQHVTAFSNQKLQPHAVAKGSVPSPSSSLSVSFVNLRDQSYSKRSHLTLLSTAEREQLDEVDDVTIRTINKKMEDFNRKKEKVALELKKYEDKLENLQQTKQKYLEGLTLGDTGEKNFSETTLRSAVKAFMWRIIAGSVTFFTSLRFSGSITTAFSIVASDFFSKSLTMFFGERLMNKSKAGRKGGADNIGRSLAKALIWRLFAICNTLTMSLVFAKDLSIASKIAGSDAIFKTGLMFAYERVWAKVEWGKEYFVEFSI